MPFSLRSEEHTSELQSRSDLVCRLLLEKKTAVRTIRDLQGKTVAVPALDSSRYVFLASMVAYVGLDPRKDINVVTHPGPESIQLLSEGKIDAYLGFPPEPQEMREQQIGHVVVNSTVDRPWAQYFCCMLAGNREFVRTQPVATKRAP